MNSYEARKVHKYDVCRPLGRATGEIFFVALLEPNLGKINWELLSLKEAPLSPFNHIILWSCPLCGE